MSVRGDIFNTAGTNGTVTKAEITLPKRDPKDEVRSYLSAALLGCWLRVTTEN
jgi:hypothetical protein